MNKHTIVVGLGRVGDASIDALTRHGVEVVGIDTDTESCDRGRARNVAVMQGDATRDSVLRDAGVDRATALICTIDDMAATSVVLAARALAPTLRIIVRVNDETNGERLLRAGASKVIAPYASVGDDIAMTAINADVVDRHALPVLGMVVEEVIVSTQSPAIDQTAPQLRQRFDLADVTILRLEDNRWSATDHPAADGDVVVLLGTPNDVETAITWVTAHGSQHVAGAP